VDVLAFLWASLFVLEPHPFSDNLGEVCFLRVLLVLHSPWVEGPSHFGEAVSTVHSYEVVHLSLAVQEIFLMATVDLLVRTGGQGEVVVVVVMMIFLQETRPLLEAICDQVVVVVTRAYPSVFF
jgi:hypothetical protein